MVAHSCNPSTGEAEANLVCIMCAMSVKATYLVRLCPKMKEYGTWDTRCSKGG